MKQAAQPPRGALPSGPQRRPHPLHFARIAGCAIFLAGCGALPGSDANERATMVVVPYHGDEWGMGPSWDDTPRRLVFQHMVYYDELWCGDPQPGIAEQWEHTPDLREWTLHLRRENHWHDGVPVTAHDIKFTLDLWNHPDVEYWYGRDLDSVVVVDDYTVKLYHDRPSQLALDSWIVYYPRHLLKDLDPKGFYKWEFWTRPVGNGPFRYVRHVPKALIEYEANPDFWGGEPEVKRLILRFGEGTLPQLLAGDIDLLPSVTPLTALKVKDDPRFYTYQEWIPSPYFVIWNLKKPLLDDVRVRRALTLALDRKALHATLGYPDSVPVTDGLYTACQFATRRLPEPLPYDPEAARRLLEEAGWVHRDGDGVRERDGRPLRFELRAAEPITRQAAVFVQAALRDVGVAVDIAAVEQSVHQARLRAGDFDAVIDGRPGPGYLLAALRRMPGGYSNPDAWALMERMEETGDPEQRDSSATALSAILREDLPITYLAPRIHNHIVASRIQGLSRWRGPLDFLQHARIEGRR